jgi:hypothetical protein
VIKQFFTSIAIVGVSLVLISWGGTGHRIINNKASLSFNSEMADFSSWVTFLTDHASDADSRKGSDPTEGPKHYIDIDNYPSFISNGTIDQVNVGSTSNGILPWATETAFNNLKNSFIAHDWANAKQYAADLGHYVADGHMPLHITKNFDGSYTGNSGVHSRYESNMIGDNSSLLIYTGDNISTITNVNQYIFDYIYSNYKYVDSVIIADTDSKILAGGTTSSTVYKQALWNKTKGFTIKMFKNGSHALTELIYTAWVQAGKPSISTSDEQNPNIQFTEVLQQNSPNPFTISTQIRYNLNENSDVTLQVKDVLGNNVVLLYQGFKTAGSYSIDWYPQNRTEGIYFIVLDTNKLHLVKKMLLVSGN